VIGRTKDDSTELADDGLRDALTRYTTALTGAYYFIPSLQALGRFATEEELR
jgi:porphyrinogen peroxidase